MASYVETTACISTGEASGPEPSHNSGQTGLATQADNEKLVRRIREILQKLLGQFLDRDHGKMTCFAASVCLQCHEFYFGYGVFLTKARNTSQRNNGLLTA